MQGFSPGAWQKDKGMEPILLIDDDVELCAMLSDYLGRHDYKVAAAHDGKTGLAKALGGSYSIMLLDVMLPGLDGFEVLRRLRAAASPMSVLLLTARGEDVDRIVGLEIGANSPPPFNAGARIAYSVSEPPIAAINSFSQSGSENRRPM